MSYWLEQWKRNDPDRAAEFIRLRSLPIPLDEKVERMMEWLRQRAAAALHKT